MSPDDKPDKPSDSGKADRQDRPAPPEQSREDTDTAWGERPEADEDDRLRRDRPPHWDSE